MYALFFFFAAYPDCFDAGKTRLSLTFTNNDERSAIFVSGVNRRIGVNIGRSLGSHRDCGMKKETGGKGETESARQPIF